MSKFFIVKIGKKYAVRNSDNPDTYYSRYCFWDFRSIEYIKAHCLYAFRWQAKRIIKAHEEREIKLTNDLVLTNLIMTGGTKLTK